MKQQYNMNSKNTSEHFVVLFFFTLTAYSSMVMCGVVVLDEQSSECSNNGFYRDNSYNGGDPEYNKIVGDQFFSNRKRNVNATEIINEFASNHCLASSSNPKFSYTSKGLCTIKFHTISTTGTRSSKSDGYLSTLCSDTNLVKSVKDNMLNDPPKERLVYWPDSCVGNYQRCYDIIRNRAILLRHICTSTSSQLQSIPVGTTHVSVDCRDDKIIKINWLTQQISNTTDTNSIDTKNKDGNIHKEYIDANKMRQHEYFIFLSCMLLVGACMCCCLFFILHRYAFIPYLKTIKRTKSDTNLYGYNNINNKMNNNTSEIVPLCETNINNAKSSTCIRKSAESPI